jgi:hypothetical protein
MRGGGCQGPPRTRIPVILVSFLTIRGTDNMKPLLARKGTTYLLIRIT